MRFASAALAALVLLPFTAAAQVPQRLGYQGRLLKADGTPESGIVAITFSVYGAASGGQALWSETQSVGTTSGFYSTFLGAVTPLPASLFDGSDRYLALTIAGNELSPRQRVGSVPYALRAGEATSVTGGAVDATSLSVGGKTVIDASGHLAGPAGQALSGAGTLNDAANPVDWSKLKGVPAGFADGTDDVGLTAVQHDATLAGAGTAASPLSVAAPPPSVPAGTLLPFAGAAAPAGYLLADGSAVSRTTYAALFAAIGTAYGAGDGSTTFNLPDMRGRVFVGLSAGGATEVSAIGKNDGLAAAVRNVSHSHRPSAGSWIVNAAGNGEQVGSGTNSWPFSSRTSGDANNLDKPAYLVGNYLIKI